MSYYSQVAIMCDKPTYGKFIKIIKEYKMNRPTRILHYDDEVFMVFWESIQWFPKQRTVMKKLIETMEDTSNEDLSWTMIRIGENTTDIELKTCNSDFSIDTRRKIMLPVNMTDIDYDEELGTDGVYNR